jgi:hypothetical protein
MGPRYPVCRVFHELRKIVHNAHSVTRQQTVALLSLIWSESIHYPGWQAEHCPG